MTVVHFLAEKPSVSMALAFCLWSPEYENLPTTKECCRSFRILLTDSEIYVISWTFGNHGL
jgi:hypothetical protein